MTPAASKARAPSIGPVIAVAVGSSWAFASVVLFAQPNFQEPVSVLDWLAVVSFSIAAAVLAAGAWLIAELSDRSKSVVTAAAITAIAGLVLAISNFIEDGLGVEAFFVISVLGILGVLVGLVGLVVTLVLKRRFLLAALAIATLAGLVSIQTGGGLLILAAWLVLAVGPSTRRASPRV